MSGELTSEVLRQLQSIGRLEGTIGAVSKQLNELLQLRTQLNELVSAQATEQRLRAVEAERTERRISEIRNDVATATDQIEALTQMTSANTAQIQEFSRLRERFIGGRMVLTALGAAMGGGIALGWRWLFTKMGL
ncbi:hypothetical protein C8N35_11637 [Breoghania corrubedonensis]|uniref:DUF1515 domain-containing protein n=1 Tax=Breoghania corrubedonensis TaxID=665038 RepID=A0A2T5UQ20_9HYPH|nr:hypothetical protein [Breoghania corrubedonensis]PTW53582.1 hypothetical protein C8N35_11637 [Breoghania corrubedonensis]